MIGVMSLSKFHTFKLVYKYFLTAWIIFIPGIAMASSADGKAIKGMELYRKQEFNRASQKFLEARNGKPGDPKISYNLGNSRYKQGEFEKALQDYSRSVEQKSDSPMKQKAAYNIGNALFRMDKLDESVSAYKKALELDPNDMDAKFNLEFVREQIEKKKQEQQKQDKSKRGKEDQKSADKKNQNDNDQQNQTDSESKENDPSSKKKPELKDNREQNESQDDPSRSAEAPPENMTKDEAERRLSGLTEDLKKFQRKQALDMKSIFTYQGNDW